MYPRVFNEMKQQHLSGRKLIMRTNLIYQTTFPKLKRGGKITLDEAIAIRKALGLNMDLEELFAKVG